MDVVATSYINGLIRKNGIKSVQLSHDALLKRGIAPVFRTAIANYYDRQAAETFVSKFVEEVKHKHEINARDVISKVMNRTFKHDVTKYITQAGISLESVEIDEIPSGQRYMLTKDQAEKLETYVKETYKKRGKRRAFHREVSQLDRLEAKIDKLLTIWESK